MGKLGHAIAAILVPIGELIRVPMHPGKSWSFQALESPGKTVRYWKVRKIKA